MTQHILLKLAAITITVAAIGASPVSAQSGAAQITVLYDAFGKTSTMKKDWGFAALIEYGGKRILFDTGNNADIFAHNVEAKGIDLRQLDFAVVSHRHGDHTWGMLDVPFLPDSPHFRAWAQTCPLNEWVRYEGPIGDSRWMSCDVYMTERPDPPSSTRKTNRGYGRGS